MLLTADDWDPNILFKEIDAPGRIYGDNKGELFAVVDYEDYLWACQWRWSPKWSRGGRKVYLRRNLQIGPKATRVQKTLFLHAAILDRHGILAPCELYTMIDHKDGNSLNCRKANLRWVTPSMNALSARRKER